MQAPPATPPRPGEVIVGWEVLPLEEGCSCELNETGLVALVLLIIFFWPLFWIPMIIPDCKKVRSRVIVRGATRGLFCVRFCVPCAHCAKKAGSPQSLSKSPSKPLPQRTYTTTHTATSAPGLRPARLGAAAHRDADADGRARRRRHAGDAAAAAAARGRRAGAGGRRQRRRRALLHAAHQGGLRELFGGGGVVDCCSSVQRSIPVCSADKEDCVVYVVGTELAFPRL